MARTFEERSKSAKKAARTRANHAAAMKRWLEVDKPAREMEVMLINRTLVREKVRLRWAGRYGIRLKNGVTGATLLQVLGTGMIWRVLIDGYKHPKDYHPNFWEVV